MEKKILQDIRPSGRRGVRSLPLRKLEREREEMEREVEEVVEIEEREEEKEEKISIRRVQPNVSTRIPPRKAPTSSFFGGKRKFPTLLITFSVIFVGIAIIAVALSLLYSKAVVTITPKTAHFNVNGTNYTARKNVTFPDLGYEVATASETAQQTIPATEGPLVQTKAKGSLTIYNAQTAAQKIVAGSRVANTAGLVYRTATTITVPAQTTNTPGTVLVTVIADQAGANYNMLASNSSDTFKVVAYKGTPKYTTVYGKIKTDISGGFSGTKKIISPEAIKTVTEALKSNIQTKLLAGIPALVPAGSLFYKTGYTITYEIPEPSSKDKATADVMVKGTINAVTFKKDALIKYIANKELDKFPSTTYDIKGMEELAFNIINTKDFSAQKGTPLIFSLKGPVTLTGTFSLATLKNELKGTYLKNSNAIFSHYPAIANAYALITPFWMRSFPNAPEKIELDVKN